MRNAAMAGGGTSCKAARRHTPEQRGTSVCHSDLGATTLNTMAWLQAAAPQLAARPQPGRGQPSACCPCRRLGVPLRPAGLRQRAAALPRELQEAAAQWLDQDGSAAGRREIAVLLEREDAAALTDRLASRLQFGEPHAGGSACLLAPQHAR